MKKSLILVILVSLVILMSACTITTPSPKLFEQNCCKVESNGITIGCTGFINKYLRNDVSCNELYGSYVDTSGGTSFTDQSCDNVPGCFGVTNCMGIYLNGLPYLLNDQSFSCSDNILYHCNNKNVVLTDCSLDNKICDADTGTCGGAVCVGIFSENGIDYPYSLTNDQYKCGQVGTSIADYSYHCVDGNLEINPCILNGKSCDSSNRKCSTEYALDSNLVLYMTFDDATAENPTATDLSENGNNGVVHSAVVTTSGLRNTKAYQFDGIDDYITLPSGVNIASSNFTMSAWFRVLDDNTRYTISFANSNSNTPVIELYTKNTVSGEFCGFARSDSGEGPLSICTENNDGASDGNWHYGTLTREDNNFMVYLDGQLLMSKTASLGITTLNTFNIGVVDKLVGKLGYFNGIMDDVRIYNKTLTYQQVSDLYTSSCPISCNVVNGCSAGELCKNPGKCNSFCSACGVNNPCQSPDICLNPDSFNSYCPLSTGLSLYMNFDDGTATDLSGNKNHGTMFGGLSCSGSTINKACYFDGVDDYIILPSGVNIASSNFTMSAWFRVLDNNTRYIISFANSNSNNNQLIEIYTNNTKGGEFCGFARSNSGGGPASVCTGKNDGASDGNWHYGTLTREDNNFMVYLDGQYLMSKIALLGTTTLDNFRIGVLDRYNGKLGYFNGIMDEVRVYNRTLSIEEIRLLFESFPPAIACNVVNGCSAGELCKNPGTINSFCSACDDNTDCSSGSICYNPGTPNSFCSVCGVSNPCSFLLVPCLYPDTKNSCCPECYYNPINHFSIGCEHPEYEICSGEGCNAYCVDMSQ